MRNAFYAILLIVLSTCKKTSSTFLKLQPNKDNGGLILSDGFAAIVVTEGIGESRHIAVNSNNDIYVKLRKDTGSNGNVALRDVNGDGKADIIKRFGDYPNDGKFATEMRIHNGYLYFSSELVVYRQKLSTNQLIPEGKPEVIMVDEFPIRWHNAKSLAFDKKGGMYVTFSAPTNACEDYRLTGGNPSAIVKGEYPCTQLNILGGIWKFDEAKLNQKQKDGIRFATGLRSIVGLSWNDEFDKLYAINHGRDYLHNHAPQYYSKWDNSTLPAEELMVINQNDDFGWPYSYYDHFKKKRMLAPEYGGNGLITEDKFSNPIMGMPAHWAPNDLLFYKGDQFPSRYNKGVFIAFHGSTNRSPYPQAGYIVAFIPFKNGKPFGEWEVFADGFAGVKIIKEMADSKYRPMGLAEGPDGSLYISESKKGKIWRIIFQGDKNKFNPESLKKMETMKFKSYLKKPDKILDLVIKN